MSDLEGLKLIPPLQVPPEQFPESEELPEGVKTVTWKDTYGFGVEFLPNVVYANRGGINLHLQIMVPKSGQEPDRKWPLIMFVQGSAWHKQDVFDHLPNLIRMAQRGFAVAIVEYRPSDIAPFPAQVQDTKAAIHYMKINAGKYRVDADRTALWGDSSGGHTALMAGFTGDGEPDMDAYREQSAAVKCIVDWYGPTDIAKMNYYPSSMDHTQADSPEGFVIGRKNVLENPELADATVPMNYLSREKETPPLLIMHGGSDMLVPFNQSCRLYERMKELGKNVEFIKLAGANHGFMGFNCDEALDAVEGFLRKYI